MFDDYLTTWKLTPDGDPIVTHSSHLLPVRQNGMPAMLKIATGTEEIAGNAVMAWWDGDGAARVLAHDRAALLLERAEGIGSLRDMARGGRDAESARILCACVRRLHEPRSRPLPPLVPLTERFRQLEPATAIHGGILSRCADAARRLLSTPRDAVILHGDIHHDNILDFGEKGWLAIDPKGLHGEHGFDYANLFTNPDAETATIPGRVARLADIVAKEAGLERERLLLWVLAWCGLSAAWLMSDGDAGDLPLAVAGITASELGHYSSVV